MLQLHVAGLRAASLHAHVVVFGARCARLRFLRGLLTYCSTCFAVSKSKD